MKFKFNELAAVEVGANLLSAAGAVAMAFYGLEYWALVLSRFCRSTSQARPAAQG
jgi:hypothetical protein